MQEKEKYKFRVDRDTGKVVVHILLDTGEKQLSMSEFEDYIKKSDYSEQEKKKAHEGLSNFNKSLLKGLNYNPKKKTKHD